MAQHVLSSLPSRHMSTRSHGSEPSGSAPPLVFWLALAVLLLNDHVLKGSGWASGAVTGKLSDFAWLVVAPVALARLARARDVGGRAVVLGAIGCLFVVTELSQTAADAVCAFASHLGVHGRLWADPTDLVALTVLPLTWHAMAPASQEAGRTLGRVAVGLGAFASIATTGPVPPQPPRWTTAAYLVNRSGAAVDARVRWSSAAVDCTLIAGADIEHAVSGVIFDTAITYRLLDQETVPLEQPDPSMPGSAPPLRGTCQLVLVAVDGAPDTIVLVPADTVSVLATQAVGPLEARGRAVEITLRAPGYDLVVGSELRWGLRDDRRWASTCTELRPALEVSTGLRMGTPANVVERSVGSDGCTQIVTDDGARTFLCVPESMVPFDVGDAISLLERGTERIAISGPTSVLRVVRQRWGEPYAIGPFVIAAGGIEDCSGERDDCGAFVRPFHVSSGASVDADGVAELDGARLALGRSEHVVIAPSGCDAEHAMLGPILHYAVLEPR